MPNKYSGLNQLIEQDKEANRYFESLPDYVKETISARSENINSFASLCDYAENLLRDDE
jgi:hypothetical protein